jgi:hypothetical protein
MADRNNNMNGIAAGYKNMYGEGRINIKMGNEGWK